MDLRDKLVGREQACIRRDWAFVMIGEATQIRPVTIPQSSYVLKKSLPRVHYPQVMVIKLEHRMISETR